MNSSLCVIILAAGKGTRMRSKLPKVLHSIGHKPMLFHVIEGAYALNPAHIIVVLGPEMEEVAATIHKKAPAISLCVQQERLGTGHAVQTALPLVPKDCQNILILYADTPLIPSNRLSSLLETLHRPHHAVALLTFHAQHPSDYGRIIHDPHGHTVTAIVEAKDANDAQKRITLCNAGVMAFHHHTISPLLAKIEANNQKGEYYLTDLVQLANEAGFLCGQVVANEEEVMGVNCRAQLAEAEALLQQRLRKAAMDKGVTMIDPDSVFLCSDTQFGQDITIQPNVIFGPGVIVEDDVEIRAFSHIEGAHIHKGARIGPFARIRPHSTIGTDAHVGNFVEIKNTQLAEGVKVNHLSYIGDTDIGTNTNVGAGTITCNYDGKAKHHTTIGQDCFIGSQSCFIAPVTMGDGAMTAAGSVITENIPAGELAIGRARQVNKPKKSG